MYVNGTVKIDSNKKVGNSQIVVVLIHLKCYYSLSKKEYSVRKVVTLSLTLKSKAWNNNIPFLIHANDPFAIPIGRIH